MSSKPRVAALLAVCVLVWAAMAQTTDATVSGTVTDPAGAVVPDAPA